MQHWSVYLKKLLHHYNVFRTQWLIWIFKLSSREHVTPCLLQLHWLPVCWHIQFKLCCIMYSVFYGTWPEYLMNTVEPTVAATHILAFTQCRRLTSHCHGVQSSVKMHSQMHGMHYQKICMLWVTQRSSENRLQVLMFTETVYCVFYVFMDSCKATMSTINPHTMMTRGRQHNFSGVSMFSCSVKTYWY